MSATQGTPRRWSAIPTAWADSGGEVVITQSKRRSRCSRSARERANGTQAATSASGTKTLLSGCGRPLYVGESNIAPTVSLAREPGAPALRVGGPLDVVEPVVVECAVGGRGEDRDLVAAAAQPLGHRGTAQDAGVTAGRIEVGDQQQSPPRRVAHDRPFAPRASIASA